MDSKRKQVVGCHFSIEVLTTRQNRKEGIKSDIRSEGSIKAKRFAGCFGVQTGLRIGKRVSQRFAKIPRLRSE
jgi:hypothetical protein